MFEKYIKPIIILLATIIICSILARTLSGSETLTEYANKYPEIAYGEDNNNSSD
ncbi:hypothetical protein [Butyrivibrio sp. WCE2006]|uniref:hypothetical protein n=1 Tax=Butyrivibrio sp. WCE2006 TaxID=1410611 RepID=UPI000B331347